MSSMMFLAESSTGKAPPGAATGCPRLLSALMMLLLPALAACQSSEPLGRIVTPSEVRASDPPLNPKPKHIIRLYGRAPETLDFRFRKMMVSTSQDGDCWNHAGFWEGGGEKGWGYDLYPVRNGEYWEADFVVDRYLPGRCEWKINASLVILVTPVDARGGDNTLGGMLTVVGDARLWDETAPQCKPGMNNCDEARRARRQNADDTIPVQVRCGIRPPERRIGEIVFYCNEFSDYKDLHYVKDHTRRIRIDLYDLDHEPLLTGSKETAP